MTPMSSERMRDEMAATSHDKVKKSLIFELKKRGLYNDINLSLIDDYMNYYDQELSAIQSIKKKGRVYKAISSTGKEYDKDNPDVKSAIEFNKRKLEILSILGLDKPPDDRSLNGIDML